MKRRSFLQLSGAAAAGAGLPSVFADAPIESNPFHLKFAPHPKMLAGAPEDYLGQLQFAYDLGFRAWEDNGLGRRGAELQQQVGDFCRDKGIDLGVMVIYGSQGYPLFQADAEQIKKAEEMMRYGVEVSKRTGQTCMTMVPGPRVPDRAVEKQIEGSVDFMKRCCDIVEDHGIIMVQEPLSHGVKGGPPLLRTFVEGHLLCKLVGRKSCKLLADFYHEGQIGNDLLPNAEKVWDEAAYVQIGDVPGRKEPGSGKLDYAAVMRWLVDKGYTGIIGMEHGTSVKGPPGLRKLLDAYRAIDIKT